MRLSENTEAAMDSDSVISRLAQIESGAGKVLDDAVARKSELNDAMKKKTEDFDAACDAETEKKISDIKSQLQKDTEAQLVRLRGNVKTDLAAIQERFDKSHSEWSDELVKDILK
jgi:ATP/maltotriose-dependent transcriptional regulator MalT